MLRKIAVFGAAFTVLLALGMATTASAGACLPRADTPSEGSGISVRIKDCAFGPTILHTPVGGLVTWTNEDFLPHAVAGAGWYANPEPFGTFNPGTSVSYRFTAPGIYAYMCHVHPGMAGIVIVGDVAFPPPPPAPIQPDQIFAAPVAPDRVEPNTALALAAGAALVAVAFARWPRRWRVSGVALRAALADRRDHRLGDYELVELAVGDDVDERPDRSGQHHHPVPGGAANA